MQEIPLTALLPHPANCNVMPADALHKLREHLRLTDRYPPLIVRPHGARYQLLDGHHRALCLRQLGRTAAQCLVWDVDDAQALLLLATLNRLQGQDDPKRRSDLLAALRTHWDLPELLQKLPDSAATLERLAVLQQPPPRPHVPQSLEELPVAVHFFLRPTQRDALERRLSAHGPDREAALLAALNLTPR